MGRRKPRWWRRRRGSSRSEPVTIGGPIPNYTCYVVDDAAAPAGPRAGGRTAHRRPRRGPWLPEARRADGGEVHRQPLRAGRARSRALPVRRRRRDRRGGQHPVPRPHRRPSEAARLPHRARRDRVADRDPAGRASGRRGAAPRRRARPARGLPGRPGGGRARRRGAAGRAAGRASALHGAVAFRGAGGPASAVVRQGRPQRAEARRPGGAHRRRPGGSPHADRGGAARGRARRAAGRRHPVRRRLLHRPRRPLAAGGPVRLRGAPDAVARRHHAAGHVQGPQPARHRRLWSTGGRRARARVPRPTSASRRPRSGGGSCAGSPRRWRCPSSCRSPPPNGSASSSPTCCSPPARRRSGRNASTSSAPTW